MNRIIEERPHYKIKLMDKCFFFCFGPTLIMWIIWSSLLRCYICCFGSYGSGCSRSINLKINQSGVQTKLSFFFLFNYHGSLVELTDEVLCVIQRRYQETHHKQKYTIPWTLTLRIQEYVLSTRIKNNYFQ